MTDNSSRIHEAETLIELRGILEELEIRTKASVGKNEFFYAFLHTDINGFPSDGLFVVIRDGTHFSWSRDGRHPINDIPGAARKIARIIREQGEQ